MQGRFYSLSTAEIEAQLPKVPVMLSGQSASIASLVWQLAAKEKKLENVQDELAQVVESMKTQAPLRRLAVDPFIPSQVRPKVIEALLKDSQATELTKRLLESLAEENALAAMPQIKDAFDEIMLAFKKEVHCYIITAQVMDKLEKTELRKQAEAFVPPGYQLVLKEKVDKKIQGGFILEFEDRRVDMSQAKKQEEFNNLVSKLEADLLS